MLGILLRLLYVFWMGEDLLEGDAFYYVDTAKVILAGESYLPEWPPALPYYLSVFGLIFGENLWSWVVGMFLLYLLFNWMWKETASLFLHEKWVNTGMLVFAIMPAFVHYSTAPLSQLPIAIIILVLIWLMYRSGASWKIGLLLALGVLFRSGVASLLPLFLFFIPIKIGPKTLLPFLLSFICLIGLWQYKSWQMTERFVWINDFNSYNFYVGNNAWTPDYKTWWLGSHDERGNEAFQAYYQQLDSIRRLSLPQQSLAFGMLAARQIEAQPIDFIYRSSNRIRCFFAFDTYTGARIYAKHRGMGILVLLLDAAIFVLLGALALLSLIKGRSRLFPENLLYLLIALIALIALYALPYMLAFAHPTYHFPLIPLFALFAFRGIEQIGIKDLLLKYSPWSLLFLGIFILIQIEWIWHMFKAFS